MDAVGYWQVQTGSGALGDGLVEAPLLGSRIHLCHVSGKSSRDSLYLTLCRQSGTQRLIISETSFASIMVDPERLPRG